MMEPWMDPIKFGVWYGGLGGGMVGILGGALGAAAGVLAPKGKGRTFVVGGFVVLIAIGLANVALGVYALSAHQPYGIWYPLVLIGGILTIVCGSLLPLVRKRYEQAEMRRMDAAAFRRA